MSVFSKYLILNEICLVVSSAGGINLFPYFSSSCYSGYGDEDGGFYDVFSKIFQEIEELERQEDDSERLVPEIGGSTTQVMLAVIVGKSFFFVVAGSFYLSPPSASIMPSHGCRLTNFQGCLMP